VPFAQAGIAPLVAFADRFGIPWHLVADGDEAGKHYAAKARRMLRRRPEARHLTLLVDRDLEHFLWRSGYDGTYRQAAGQVAPGAETATIIRQALHARSKPGMALAVAEEAGMRGAAGIPPLLGRLFANLQALAKRV
jgi:putative ATP-dependent endonuclease of OLD family